MSLRAATLQDAPAIARVFEACWREAYPGMVPQPVIEKVAGDGLPLWTRLLQPEGGHWPVVVWGQPGEVSGVIRFGRDPDQPETGHVFSLYVDPSTSGRGIGAALIRHAQDWFVENGLSRATLWVFEANARARGFYAAQRWRPDGQTRIEAEFETPEVRLSWRAIETELESLETERSRPELSELDTLAVPELVRLMNEEDAGVAVAVGAAAAQISAAVTAVTERLAAGGRLIYIGAGTAGRLGILDATECIPTFNTKPGQVLGLIAGGGGAMAEAVEGAEDDASGGERDLRAIGLSPQDVVVGISASGRTPYVLGAVEYANQVGAASVGVACNLGTLLGVSAQHPIEVAVGPEMIAAVFAYGGSGVAMLTRAKPRHDISALRRAAEMSDRVVAALGFGAGLVRIIETDDPDQLRTMLDAAPTGIATQKPGHLAKAGLSNCYYYLRCISRGCASGS